MVVVSKYPEEPRDISNFGVVLHDPLYIRLA
jgi:hypothetical protein